MKIYALIVMLFIFSGCARHHSKNRFDILEFLPQKEEVAKSENVQVQSRPQEEKASEKGWLW